MIKDVDARTAGSAPRTTVANCRRDCCHFDRRRHRLIHPSAAGPLHSFPANLVARSHDRGSFISYPGRVRAHHTVKDR